MEIPPLSSRRKFHSGKSITNSVSFRFRLLFLLRCFTAVSNKLRTKLAVSWTVIVRFTAFSYKLSDTATCLFSVWGTLRLTSMRRTKGTFSLKYIFAIELENSESRNETLAR